MEVCRPASVAIVAQPVPGVGLRDRVRDGGRGVRG